MKRLAAAFIGLLLLSPAASRAEEGDSKPLFKVGQRNTLGTGGYVGHGGYIQYGDEWRLKGGYSDYRFDGSTGTTRSFSARGAFQGENLSLGLNASVTPRNDAYANRSFGVDGAWTFILDEGREEESGLQDFELGAWWAQTRHSQIVPGTAVLLPERIVIINQHDFGVNAALTAWDFNLALDASRTIYDQDFDDLPAAVRFRPRLTETAALVNGFPERSGSARLEYSGWRPCAPYVSAVATRYKIQPQPNSLTAGAGVALRWGNVVLDLGYELTRQKGSPDSKYFNFGGSVRF
ncbi:MAG: hypothetical protein HY923_06480 [Elusimicrobia bacterium]|nr:hypothetical protein [Elusimicrobiota bacterium]